MTVGSVVYLCWYDFQKRTEHVCKGEVVDNEPYEGTQWEHYVNVRFQPPMLSGAISHHFREEQLSLTADNVPHDDCYLVCGKKTRSFEHDVTVRTKAVTPSEAWQTVQQFKQEHWDYEHGHLATEALEEYYQMWRDAIAAKRGMKAEADKTDKPAANAAGTVVKKHEVVQLNLFD